MSYLFQSFCFVSTTHHLWDPTIDPSSTRSLDETTQQSSEPDIPGNQNRVQIRSHPDEPPVPSTASMKNGQLPPHYLRMSGTYYLSPYSDAEDLCLLYATVPHLSAPGTRGLGDQELGRGQEHTNNSEEQGATPTHPRETIDPREKKQLQCKWEGCDHPPFDEKSEILQHISARHLLEVKYHCRHAYCNKAYKTKAGLLKHNEDDH
ncbi:hypothetical protein N7520_008177 [Penicillium odoratum]|uniref:uncharacterized protein n=1 Tax=Penicillium odoratum TaxID=1167516 RepID=UPI002547EF10|nr:uncharacterized protein N7520_008177 [Penicillium odoratum]KAJ5761021.1 hypothetical protein N7520_008177 [Penicillium odoratum]